MQTTGVGVGVFEEVGCILQLIFLPNSLKTLITPIFLTPPLFEETEFQYWHHPMLS
jgi:hypothetical protein